MKTSETIAPITESPAQALHSYQVYRQAKNGVHEAHGPSIASAEKAVEAFLDAAPAFNGGGIRLWDHHEGRAVAAADWFTETTHFGFRVRVRANAFYDHTIAHIARTIIEREALLQSYTERMSGGG